ncbi:MAG: hypothetical protein VB130_04980 [Clostridium sp.]|nr:hypothetical protein [Clostridium sp.]
MRSIFYFKGVDKFGIGYAVGCLFSILFWKVDRHKLLKYMDLKIRKIFKYPLLVQAFYILSIILVCLLLKKAAPKELYNAITAFLVIDISNTERYNLSIKEKVDFYNTITTITRAIVCGFIAPLLYILILGNYFAITYTIIHNLSYEKEYKLFLFIWRIFTIVPSLILQMFLYVIFVIRTKEISIDYKNEYISGIFINPLLNANILAAYVESINFYYYFNIKGTDYIKSYGKYNNSIEYGHIKDYLAIAYIVCTIFFIIFLGCNIAKIY